MWFKKKTYISGYNSNTAVDGTDWRITSKRQFYSTSQTLPSAADAGNYFYLPALGWYAAGRLDYVGHRGYYWSSSADPQYSYDAYALEFIPGSVNVGNDNRRGVGHRVGGFE